MSAVVYEQPKTLWMNNHAGRFRDVSSRVCETYGWARALRSADFDNAGHLDFLQANTAKSRAVVTASSASGEARSYFLLDKRGGERKIAHATTLIRFKHGL
jgi:hypothetical protein